MKQQHAHLKMLLPILVVIISVGIAWAIVGFKSQVVPQSAETPAIPEVNVVIAQPQTLKLNVFSQGVVMPREEIYLVAEVGGKVVQINPAMVSGGFFTANELLLTIDPRDYDYAIIAAEASIAEAKRVLIAEQAQVEQAKSEWQALGEGEASALAQRKPQLAESEAKLKAAVAALAKAKLNRSRCELHAPFSGRVLNKQVGLGQYIQPGSVTARIYADDVAEVRLPISIKQLGFLNLSLALANSHASQWPKVTLTGELGGQQNHWIGRVVRSEAAIAEDSGQLYLVAQVNNSKQPLANQLPLLKGLFLQAEIEGKERSDVYRLPRNVVSPMQTVKLVNREQRLEIRKVEVLRTEAESVVIKDGLDPYDRVVISELPIAISGTQVKVIHD